jgi:hypothetical protein
LYIGIPPGTPATELALVESLYRMPWVELIVNPQKGMLTYH